MKNPKDISFVRLDVLENWRFWNEFRGDLEAAGREVIAEADALLAQDMTKNERAARLLSESIEFRKKKQAAGQAGGLAKARNSQEAANGNAAEDRNPLTSCTTLGSGKPARGAAAKHPLRNRWPTTKEEFRQFVYEQDLNISIAEDWYAIHEARDWTDNEGGPLKNWKGALTNYCRSRENQLRSNHDGTN